jgi:hypothetical protein
MHVSANAGSFGQRRGSGHHFRKIASFQQMNIEVLVPFPQICNDRLLLQLLLSRERMKCLDN